MDIEIFKCTNNKSESVPNEVLNSLEIKDIYESPQNVALVSQKIKDFYKDTICKLPFCNTVEGEALGGIIKYQDDIAGARVKEYIINDICDLNKIKDIDFENGRIYKVLEAIKILKSKGEFVCLCVEGPFTISNCLLDTRLFYKFLRKEKDKMKNFLNIIQKNIVKYMEKAIENGVDIISYADPVGTYDIVGPKMYKDISGKITYEIFKEIQPKLKNCIIHVCGKTSTSLEKIDLAKNLPISISKDITYGEILKNTNFKFNNINFIGNWCIKRSNLNKNDGVLWNMVLK